MSRFVSMAFPSLAKETPFATAMLALAIGALAHVAPGIALLALAALTARLFAAGVEFSRDAVLRLLPPLAASIAVGAAVSFAAGIGVLFVWRVVSDTAFSMRRDERLCTIYGVEESSLGRLHLLAMPALGLVMVAHTAPHMVAGLPLDLPHLPAWAPLILAVLGLAALIDWGTRRAAEWRLGRLALAPAQHQLCHHIVFAAAYASAWDVSAGLVTLIAWRLLQSPLRQDSFTAVP